MDVREMVYARAGGRCECNMTICSHHIGGCSAKLPAEWEDHRIKAGELRRHTACE